MGIFNFLENKELRNNITIENAQMKKKIKNFKDAYDEKYTECEGYKSKYIALLEEKGTGFTQYLYYKEQYNNLNQLFKDSTKNIKNVQNDMDSIKNIVNLFCYKGRNSIPAFSKCKNINDFMFNLLICYCTGRGITQKTIVNVCKRLKISKEQIKKSSSFLYQEMKIDEQFSTTKKVESIKDEN